MEPRMCNQILTVAIAMCFAGIVNADSGWTREKPEGLKKVPTISPAAIEAVQREAGLREIVDAKRKYLGQLEERLPVLREQIKKMEKIHGSRRIRGEGHHTIADFFRQHEVRLEKEAQELRDFLKPLDG